MPAPTCRFLGFHLSSGPMRYYLPHLSSLFSLYRSSTMDLRSAFSEREESSNHTVLDERYVLGELSNLLPTSRKTSIATLEKDSSSRNQVAIRAADAFLSPEDKLRGVFLQKLKGKAAIEKALTDVGIDLSIDIVANVVNRGNLSGEEMVTFFNWAIREHGVPKDVDICNVILRALGRRKFFSHMMDLLWGMAFERVNPNLQSVTIVMDYFIRANYVQRALKLFEESEEFGVQCNTELLNKLLRCLCERLHVGSANTSFNSKKGKIPFDNSTYNTLISGWSKLGDIEQMEKILREMVEAGLNPDCLTFSHLIEGLGRAGRMDDAVEIFDHIKEKGIVPNTSVYNAMISNFISSRDFDESMRYYKRMLDNGCEPDLDTYTKLILGFIKARRVADTLEMFEEMLSRGIAPTTGVITSFLKPLCSYGPPHAALVIYQKARKAGCRISQSAYKLLLQRLSRFGKCGTLLNVWDEMQESGYACDVEVYEYIVDGLCNIGHLENAVLVMEEAIRKGFCPNRLVYSRLSNKLMASNKTEMAYKLFLKIKEARGRENARRYWRSNGWHF
ncbi:PREDICTED: putative pentatricopeptide repeat-containing protein At5g43820 [Tarenaya hassleriana]|uniref:putative pentatricopeptide repeat-containing protein At5g43820 n=1 Tax=Tarenaya hassleriana TaxID=28532 RepID=UPI00053C7915|nr:PREDICTED: putative pentatricopeptide repeat-containing protein At5g43820 [Tarenaya hassleriana]XP_010523637.1 PREDICTED: putative pentatricopeptide repeat-containing protein At5g43820 [Tarenaya hassleriana]XP_019056676.1 PREDICTED: putative pentatricopeptide repeat-containing protein At5g43820 [Tarenaya hassleriana]